MILSVEKSDMQLVKVRYGDGPYILIESYTNYFKDRPIHKQSIILSLDQLADIIKSVPKIKKMCKHDWNLKGLNRVEVEE